MAMTMIDLDKAKKIAFEKRLRPARVIGTKNNYIQFKSEIDNNPRLEVIDWGEFKDYLKERKVAIYESNGWMKIMKKR